MKNRIRILATSDLHGSIYPYSYADGSETAQGMARLSTLIQSLRDDNTLLIDNGDTLQGTPLTYFHYRYHHDWICPMTTVMNLMGYDYVNIGNHDFDYGEQALQNHLNLLKAPCITSNVSISGTPLGPNYVIREIGGKKLAIFGVITQYVPHWEAKKNIRHSKFRDAYETAAKTVELIRGLEKPDYVIGVYHGGFERDLKNGYPVGDLTGENEGYEMMRSIPGLDILISGHTHTAECGKAFHTVYTQTTDSAKDLACIDIYTDTGVIEPQILKADCEPDQKILDAVMNEEEECQKWLDTPIGTSKVNLQITDEMDARLHKSQCVTFLNMVQKEATGSDLSCTPLFLHATGFPSEITMRNIVSTYLFPNTLVVKEISGKVLREYLEKDAEFWSIRNDAIIVSPWMDYPNPQHYNYDMVDGIEYTIRVSEDPGHRIEKLTYQGHEVTDDMSFTMSMNNYRASGGGNYSMIASCPTVKEVPISMVELIADYILEHKVIDFTPVNNITVVK